MEIYLTKRICMTAVNLISALFSAIVLYIKYNLSKFVFA